MPTPHVSCAVALYVSWYTSTNGGAVPTAAQVKAAILGSAAQQAGLACVSGGRLDVAKMLQLY